MWLTGLELKNRALRDMDECRFNELYTDLSIEWDGMIKALFADDHPDEFKEFLAKYPGQDIDTNKVFGMKLAGVIKYVDIFVFRLYLGGGSEAIFRKKGEQDQPPKLESLLDLKLRNFLPLFHKALQQSTYCGLPILKNPLDLFIYQEIIYRTKPDIIIEIGTYKGGSAKYLRHLLTAIHGAERFAHIFTIDINNKTTYTNNGITYITGKATDKKLLNKLKYMIDRSWHMGLVLKNGNPDIMIIDDGSHTYDDTLANLNIYSQFVTPGQYYIVEDTICHHGLNTGPKPGPAEAVQEFLKYCGRFEVDANCERFGLTYNSGGYLRCIKAA